MYINLKTYTNSAAKHIAVIKQNCNVKTAKTCLTNLWRVDLSWKVVTDVSNGFNPVVDNVAHETTEKSLTRNGNDLLKLTRTGRSGCSLDV